jgi:uncharacterized protein YciI
MIMTTLVVGLFALLASREASGPQTTRPSTKKYVVAIFTTGPSWDKSKSPDKQSGFAKHSANLRRLRAEKKIVLGSRYADKGLILLDAKSIEEARAMFADDPTLKASVFVLDVYPWNTLFTGCVE